MECVREVDDEDHDDDEDGDDEYKKKVKQPTELLLELTLYSNSAN